MGALLHYFIPEVTLHRAPTSTYSQTLSNTNTYVNSLSMYTNDLLLIQGCELPALPAPSPGSLDSVLSISIVCMVDMFLRKHDSTRGRGGGHTHTSPLSQNLQALNGSLVMDLIFTSPKSSSNAAQVH